MRIGEGDKWDNGFGREKERMRGEKRSDGMKLFIIE
jgi:hypothetical protein